MTPRSSVELLHDIPYPWYLTHPGQRRMAVAQLDATPSEIATALSVVDRSMSLLADLPQTSPDLVPDSLYQYWDFTAEWLAEPMPTLSDVHKARIEERLAQHLNEAPSPDLVEAVGSFWLRWLVQDIARSALGWITSALRRRGDSAEGMEVLFLASKYWADAVPGLAESLISSAASVGWLSAIPLLESIENSDAGSPTARKAARDYRLWIERSESDRQS